jgi:hypothetical protein
MKFNRSIHALVATVALIVGPAVAFAHNGIEHVLGTVKAITETSITVETVNHTMTTIALDPKTTFTNKGAKASLQDLKVADRVAVDTKDDANDKPHAISVKWGATAGTASKASPSK